MLRDPPQKKALFESDSLALDLRYIVEVGDGIDSGVPLPEVVLEFLDLSHKGHKGLAVQSKLTLEEGQCVTFVLRTPPTELKVKSSDEDEAPAKPVSTNSLIFRSGLDKMLHSGQSVDDPLLTRELLALLLHVALRLWCCVRCILTILPRKPIDIGMNGSARIPIVVHGRRLYCEVLWR